MLKSSYFEADENAKVRIYKEFNTDIEQVKRDVQIIKDWVGQQPHLPDKIEDDFVEISLIRNKFSIEITKEKVDKYYTVKGRNVNEISKIPSEIPGNNNQFLSITPLPRLTDNLERIIIFKVKNGVADNEEAFLKFFKYYIIIKEFTIRSDYSLHVRIIQDLEGLTNDVFLKFMKAVRHIFKSYKGAYFARIIGIELLNVPSFLEVVAKSIKLPLLKMILSEKIANRITIHKDCESLHKNVNKAYLPPEYGGDLETSLSEIDEAFKIELRNNIEVLDKFLLNDISNESKRIRKVSYSDSFGPDGTFKNLCVD